MTELRVYQPESSIQEAWRPLAVHADGCDICLPWVAKLRAIPDDPRRIDFEVYDELCDQGKAFFTVWRLAKDEYLNLTWERRRRQLLTDEQLAADGVTFDLRAEAIMSMPADEFKAWLRLPDEQRHAQLRALEAGVREAAARKKNAELTERTCRHCGETFKVPKDSKDRYCCEQHAREAWRR